MDILVTMERLKKPQHFSRSLERGTTQQMFSIAAPLPSLLPPKHKQFCHSLKASLSFLTLEREHNCFFHIPVMITETKMHFYIKQYVIH